MLARKRAYTQTAGASSSPLAGARGSAAAQRMLEGAPLPVLLRMASPNALAFFVQAGVSMAELSFVGRLGTVPLAALALMFPGLMLIQMLANGAMGGAVSSAVARALGAGDRSRAQSLVWHGLVIGVLAGMAFCALYYLLGGWLLSAVGAPAEVSQAAADYADIVFGGGVALWVTALMSAAFRGMGNMRFPAALMMIGAAVQVPLAGTLILGWLGIPALGLPGAAVAVVAVAAINAVIMLVRLLGGYAEVSLKGAELGLRSSLFADIFRVGALAALSPVFTVLTVMSVNALVGGFGAAALAGFGIVSRVEFLLIPMVFGLGAAMTAMVGINVGAGNVARAERIGWLGGGCAAAVTGATGVLLAVFPGAWLNLFTADPDTWQAGAAYLRIVGPAFAFQGLGLSLYFAFQGAGTVAWPVLATVLRFGIGVGGAVTGALWLGLGLDAVYVFLAAGMLVYGLVTAASLHLGAWRRRGSW